MKKAYLVFTIAAITITAIALVVDNIYYNDDPSLPRHRDGSIVSLCDEEYLVSPSDVEGKWHVTFPSGEIEKDLSPVQMARFFEDGEINRTDSLVVYPSCEYQLTIEDEFIIVEDFGRPITKLPLSKTGKLGEALIKDNE